MTRRSNLKPASGTLRQNRFLKALDPASAPVDERSCADLMAFALDFSRLLRFYDSNNRPVSDWHSFFARDLSFLLADIITTDFQAEHFSGWALHNAVKEGRESIKEILAAIYRMAKRLDDWYLWSADLAIMDRKDNRLRMTLESIVQKDVCYHLGNVRHHLEQYAAENPSTSSGQETWPNYWARREARLYPRLWLVPPEEERPAIVPKDDPVEGLLAVLRALHQANHKLHDIAKQYFEELLNTHSNHPSNVTLSDHPPHTTLYISFCKLLLHLRDKINNITEQHLDFYYRQVLKLVPHGSTPDVAHLTFELAPELKNYLLPAGTLLTAGKDTGGKDIEYATDQDLLINQAHIASLKALYLAHSAPAQQEASRVTSILALPQADSEDGIGDPLKVPERGWPTFGINEATNDGPDISSLHAELGFVIASPTLLLQEGERNVIATIAFAGDGKLEEVLDHYQETADGILDATPPVENLLADAFLVYVSGEKGWIPVRNASFRRHPVVGTTLQIEFTLKPIDPAVMPNPLLAPANDGGNEWPLLKLVLNPHARVYAYSFFGPLSIETVELRVGVRGVQKLQLRNELGPLDPAQPFPVLGPIAGQGSYLLVNHRELNVKTVDHATMTITWFNLPPPPESLESYYAGYGLGIRDDGFKLRITVSGEERWEVPAEGDLLLPMFARDFDRSGGLLPVTVIAAQMPPIPLPLVERPAPPVLSEADAPRGTIRLELAEPSFGFGYQIFPGIMAQTAIKNAKAGKNGLAQALPNPPFIPVAKSVSLDYDAGEKLLLTRPLPENQKTRFYSIHPFGHLSHQGRSTPMFPGFQEQGHLYLGISGAGPRQPVTLLFQICDTAFSPVPQLRQHMHDDLLPLRWRYLAGQEWKELPARLLLSDTTKGLMRSGIVKLSLPNDIGSQGTLMPADLCWIEAAAPRVSHVYWSRVISIAAQAVSATRVCNRESELVPAVIPAGSIVQFRQKPPQIKSVTQPFASSAGKSWEDAKDFRTRVSERLRHKDRAIQGFDYERMILHQFPEVGQVKCIGHNNSRSFSGIQPVEPGTVYLVVVPRLEETLDREPRLPQHVLKNIEDYIRDHTSTFVQDVHVINPVYETLKIFANVEFSPQGDAASYRDELQMALSLRLQYWRGTPLQPMPIGSGQVQSYEISLFIQQQPYVTRLHSLAMLHTYQTEAGYVSRWLSGEQRASASAPWAVLIPAADHSIVPVDPGKKDMIDEGIRNLTVGGDFVMGQVAGKEKKEEVPELRYFLVVPAHPERGKNLVSG